jgi:uncharacterized delta-60 repeat protein
MKTITHPASKCVLAMRNCTLLFGLIFTISASVFADEPNQLWVARYNGPGNNYDSAAAMAIDDSGNVYVTGYSEGDVTNNDYATIKYSPDGNQLWVARYNNGNDIAQSLVVDSSGNVFVTGYSDGNWTDYDYATIKYSPDGNQLWVARYNGPGNGYDIATAMAIDNSGNVYVTGYSSSTSYGYDYATIKYSSNGNQLWVARYNGDANLNDRASALAVDSSGNVYVTGRSDGNDMNPDYATVKYSPDGNQLWVARYNGLGNGDNTACALAINKAIQGVYVTGCSSGSGTGSDYTTVKYSPDGNQLWVARYNGPGNGADTASALAVDNSGNVYVTGYNDGNGTGSDYATVKYSPDGNQLWTARYNSPGNGYDYAYALAIDNLPSNAYVTGYSTGSGTVTVKYGPDGNQLWVACSGNGGDTGNALKIDSSGNVYVTGRSYSESTGYDYATIKYSQPHFNCIYVDANATGANNGSSWANAYKYLQDALTAAEPNYEIWVAQGTYRPDKDTNHPGGTGLRTATFQLKNGVGIYGGFPTGGGPWIIRDPDINKAILSGHISDFCDSNTYHVVNSSGTNSTAVLDGFTITGGSSMGGSVPPFALRGAGMFNINGSPTINNCTFSGNAARTYGGGIYISIGSPTLTNCNFIGNSSATMSGGGIYNLSGSPVVTNCTFSGNSALYNGGGMCNLGSSPILTDCAFSGNDANNGGGMYVASGSVTLSDCNFSGNSAVQYGDGMYTLGAGVINIETGKSIYTADEFYISENSQIQGIGSIIIRLGGEMIVDSNAVVDLNDPNYPNITGAIQCNGLLQVKDNAKLSHAKLNVIRQAGGFFGKFQVENSAEVRDVNIYADGDRFMDVDPCTFTGIIANNRIYVTITEGQNETPEGILEVRGRDPNESHCDFNEPNVLACHLDSNTMPSFDTNSWTLERLTVTAGAKVNLVDRFSSGNGDSEVLYVKNLVLGNNCVLNVGFEHLYYTNLSGDLNSIKKGAILGFSLGAINCDSNEEFESRVSNNNFIHPTDPNYNRIYIEKVAGLQPDPNGLMKMHNLEDPCSGQIISARAKGEFAPAVEDEIRIRFNYLFTTTDPGAQIVVYLSDVNELMEPNDPYRTLHYIEVAQIPAPPVPRPGSAGSGRFGTFEMYVSTGELDLSKGTWIELELIEPVQEGGSYKLMEVTDSEEGTIVFVDDLDAGISCQSCSCLDLIWNDCLTTPDDFLIVVSETGDTDPPTCVDGGLSTDGYADTYDTASWDWTMNLDERQNLCGQVPLSEGAGGFAAGGFGHFGNPLNLLNLSDLNDLLIAGKRGTVDGDAKLKDRLYVFDSNYHYIRGLSPASDRCNIRIVHGEGDDLYQINSENGVSRLDEIGTPIVPRGQTVCANEPRYNRPATVYVGIQGTGDDSFGRPILDAAFDADFVYVVPVVVVPNGDEPNAYTVAAKLQLDQNSTPPYHVVKLYDGNLLPYDNQREYRNSLREIELDAAGNVYVTNANIKNESDILWKFEPNGTVRRLDLDMVDPTNEPYYAPTGMCISNATNVLYLASSIYNKADSNSAVIHGFSTETLAPVRTITVSAMQHVTSITEDPITKALWVAGFNFNSMPNPPNPYTLPFYDPYLAWVPLEVNSVSNVSAVCILDANNDLAMPLSIVWTGAQPQEKCGGADLDGSGTVSLPDFAWLARYWRAKCADSNNYSYCEMADLEPDGYIDLKDLDILAEHWLDTGCL